MTPRSFTLDTVPPTITVRAAYAKNRKQATQPIPADLASALPGYLSGRSGDAPVWPGTWADDAADMIRFDLEAAGIPYITEGPDGPVFADFYAATRHSYITLLAKSGVHPKLAQTLARHSSITLTMDRYTHVGLYDQAAALEALPPLVPVGREGAPLAAMGTDGSHASAHGPQYSPAVDARRGSLRTVEKGGGREATGVDGSNPLESKAVAKGCEGLRRVAKV